MPIASQSANVASDDHLAQIIETARATLDQEIRRGERLESKARGQIALAGTWFAIVQAVAGASLRDAPRGWVVVLAATAAAAALCFGLLLRASSRVWSLRTRNAVSEETLATMEHAAGDEPERFLSQVVALYRHVLDCAQTANDHRATALDAAMFWWWLALGAGFVELLSTMLSKLNL